jgi:predicted enzyme related to lactoylglutathione lyase
MKVTSHVPGTVSWIELSTTDAKSAKTLYEKLFGWTSVEYMVGEDGCYYMFQIDGDDIAGMYTLSVEQVKQGMPTAWLVHFAVENADATTEKAKALGGKVLSEPCDIFEEGRLAMIQDPTGAVFALWQPYKHIGSKRIKEHGALAWVEIATKDLNRARDFYSKLFGWTTVEHDMGGTPYVVFSNQGVEVAGLMEIQESWGDVPPHWLAYLVVDQIDKAVETAEQNGARIIMPPSNAEGIGQWSVIQDAQGGVLALLQPVTAPQAA